MPFFIEIPEKRMMIINDVAEIIFLLLLVAVAVDCWFLMPQKLFG